VDSRALLSLSVVLLLGLAYMARLYLRAQWRTAELLATLIAGSALPAGFSKMIREQHDVPPWTISMFAVLIVLGQLLAVAGTLIGMEWIKRWEMLSTIRRLAVIAYGWLILPCIFGALLFGCWLLGVRQDRYKTLCEVVGIAIALIVFLVPAQVLQSGPMPPDPHVSPPP
jgi:hypothetical protein